MATKAIADALCAILIKLPPDDQARALEASRIILGLAPAVQNTGVAATPGWRRRWDGRGRSRR